MLYFIAASLRLPFRTIYGPASSKPNAVVAKIAGGSTRPSDFRILFSQPRPPPLTTAGSVVNATRTEGGPVVTRTQTRQLVRPEGISTGYILLLCISQVRDGICCV